MEMQNLQSYGFHQENQLGGYGYHLADDNPIPDSFSESSIKVQYWVVRA